MCLHKRRRGGAGGTHFTCFTSTKVLDFLVPEPEERRGGGDVSAQFTWFTSTKVQRLDTSGATEEDTDATEDKRLGLLALMVEKYSAYLLY